MNNLKKYIVASLSIALLAGALAAAPNPQTRKTPATTQPSKHKTATTKPAATEPTSKQVMQRLLTHRPKAPAINPEQIEKPINAKTLARQNQINLNILGIAPGEPYPKLLSEGTFIISRRGRMLKSPDGFHDLFVFEGDSEKSPESPMILLPCKNLQTMEQLMQRRHSSPMFIISGQVHVYRGANYLMLTAFKIVTNRGNMSLQGH